MSCIVKFFLPLMAMIFLFLDLCTATVFIFCCGNRCMFTHRFYSFFRSQDILIMVVTVLLTLLSLPLWLYILTIIPQENKRQHLYLVVNLQYIYTVPPWSWNAMSTKLIWLYMNSSWGYFSLEALIQEGWIYMEMWLSKMWSLFLSCVHTETHTQRFVAVVTSRSWPIIHWFSVLAELSLLIY